jgi:protein transport protein SEC24
LPRFTNGQLLHYPAFDGNRDGIQLRIDLNRMVSRSIAFEAVMRIRCTKGVKVNAFYGNFFFKSNDLLATPTNDCDKAFCAELEYEEAQLAATQVHVQSALLYTTSNGERRIRVHNLNIPVSANPAEVYASADCEALATFFGRQAADLMSNAKVQDGRIKLQQALIDVVKSHRAAVQQMALPPSISCLPLYLLGMLKSSAMRDRCLLRYCDSTRHLATHVICSADVRPDERVAALHRLGGAPVSYMILQCCPYVAPLHTLGSRLIWCPLRYS